MDPTAGAQLPCGSTDFHPSQLQAWAALAISSPPPAHPLLCTPDAPAHAEAHAHAHHGLFQSPVTLKTSPGKILG